MNRVWEALEKTITLFLLFGMFVIVAGMLALSLFGLYKAIGFWVFIGIGSFCLTWFIIWYRIRNDEPGDDSYRGY